jgi:hypothetical protein
MSDDSKLQGLNFGRSLQVTWKVTTIYSVEHPAVQASLQQTFAKLQELLVDHPRFTFGFSDGRVLLDSVLTTDVSLAPLEAEFKKREIVALAFSSGLTITDLKEMFRLVSISPKAVTDAGGIEAYLQGRQVPNARIIPSGKKKGEESADVVLSVDSESFLATGGMMGQGSLSAGTISLDTLLKAAGVDEKSANVSQGLVEAVQTAIEAAAGNSEVRPESVVLSLAMFLDNMAPGSLPALPGVQGQELMSSQQVASELWESLTARWLGSRFGASSSEEQVAALQSDTAELLARAKNATEMAERILTRLGRLFEEQKLPVEWLEPVRRELAFYLLSFAEQKTQLMSLKSLSDADLRRVVRTIKGLLQESNVPDASDLAQHCCKTLVADTQGDDLIGRIPEILALIPSASQARVLRAATEQLAPALLEGNVRGEKWHESIADCLSVLGQQASRAQDFELVLEIASQFEQIIAVFPDLHLNCCSEARQKLLPAEVIDPLLDLALEKSESMDKRRIAVGLLRQSEPAIERLFERLSEEPIAQVRFRIMRLAGQLRGAAIHSAAKRLDDGRWYVVRNACVLLGEMNDPDVIEHLAPALRHPDERVQRAAFQSLQKSRLAECVRAYADALADMAPAMLESALDEIMLGKDASCVEGLCKLITQGGPDRSRFAARAVQIAVTIDSVATVALLAKAVNAPGISETVRSLVRQATELRR